MSASSALSAASDASPAKSTPTSDVTDTTSSLESPHSTRRSSSAWRLLHKRPTVLGFYGISDLGECPACGRGDLTIFPFGYWPERKEMVYRCAAPVETARDKMERERKDAEKLTASEKKPKKTRATDPTADSAGDGDADDPAPIGVCGYTWVSSAPTPLCSGCSNALQIQERGSSIFFVCDVCRDMSHCTRADK
jgi:hypothetical protein